MSNFSFPTPRCEQGDWPVDGEPISLAKREFLHAFQHINVASKKLQEIRAQPGLPAFEIEERKALEQIETTLLRKEALDALHAPKGLYAEPDFKKGFVVNVNFGSHPAASDRDKYMIVASSFVTLMELPFKPNGRTN